MAERLVLYGARTGNSLRAAVALIEAGIPFETATLNLGLGDHHTAGFLRLNPLGKVPVLTAYKDERVAWALSQSNAIMLKAAALAPGCLLPSEPVAEAKALERFFYFVTDVIGPSHAGLYLEREGFRDGALALANLAGERIENSESFFEHSAYMAGDEFSLADISAYTLAYSVRHRIRWRELPLLTDWYARVGERQSIQRGMSVFGA